MKKTMALFAAVLLFMAAFASCCAAPGQTAAVKSDTSAVEAAENGNTEYADLVVYGNIWTAEDNGILVSSSTDAPADEIIEGNIQNVIEVATTGIFPEAKASPLAPKELLTVREALMCLTLNGAKQLGIDDKCGSVVKGKNADFVILDTNFLDYKGEELRSIHKAKIQQVYFEGKEVLNNESAAAYTA